MAATQEGENRGLISALVVSVVLFAVQFAAYLNTRVLLLKAGALDTLSDMLVSGFLLVSVFWSRKPADEYHLFGHGRAQNVAALITSTVFIFVLSLETLRAALPALFRGSGEHRNIGWAMAVTVLAILVYLLPLRDILATERRGAAVKAQLFAILEMEVAFIASLVGLILVRQGYRWADPAASVFVGLIIAVSGVKLLWDNADSLIGRSPDKEFIARIGRIAGSVPGVLGVHDLRAEFVGPGQVHTGFHIEVARGTDIETANRISEAVQRAVQKETGCRYCVIHVDPATR